MEHSPALAKYSLVREWRLVTGLEEPLLWADMDISEVMLSEDGSFIDLKWVSASEEPKIKNVNIMFLN